MNPLETVVIDKIRAVAKAITRETPLSPDTLLLERQLLDSLELLQLVHELEAAFSIKIPLSELEMENFVDVAAVARMVERTRT